MGFLLCDSCLNLSDTKDRRALVIGALGWSDSILWGTGHKSTAIPSQGHWLIVDCSLWLQNVENGPHMLFRAIISSEESELAVTLPDLKLSVHGMLNSAVTRSCTLTLVFDTLRDSEAVTAQLPARVTFLLTRAQSHLCGEGEARK